MKVLKQLSISINDKSKIDDVYFNVDILKLYKDVKELLETKPQEEVIDILEKTVNYMFGQKMGIKSIKRMNLQSVLFVITKLVMKD